MKKISLFKYKNNYISNIDIIRILEKIRVFDCKILYIHSEINFGIPNPDLKKDKILNFLFECIKKMGVHTICVPTYTFSFCNKEIFNMQKTKSKMGILSEFVRTKTKSRRSVDPLLSVCIHGKDREIIKNIGKHSIGENSHFDRIHQSKNVKFLFFGPSVGSCFTYIHYLEKLMDAPYRYDRKFSGTIINNGKKFKDNYKLFVRYHNVSVGNGSYLYEKNMFNKKISLRKKVGNGLITSVKKDDACEYFFSLYKKNYNIFFKSPKSEFSNTLFNHKNILTL